MSVFGCTVTETLASGFECVLIVCLCLVYTQTMRLVCTNCEVLLCFTLHWECQSAVPLACNLSATTDQVQLSIKVIFECIYEINVNFHLRQDLYRTIIDLGHPPVPTGLVSMVLSAT